MLGAHKYGRYDEVLAFEQLPSLPDLNFDELLVKVSYADINPVDFQKLGGGKPGNCGSPIPNGPFVPGFGGSGVVQEAGSPSHQKWVGKQVCFLVDPSKQRGSYASHVAVNHRCVALIPKHNVDLRDAAAIPVAGLTAYECLVKLGLVVHKERTATGKLETAGIAEDSASSNEAESSATTKANSDTLLVVGGSGGVGSWIITLARAYHPHLNIIATASSESFEWVQSLGATKVIDHSHIASQLETGPKGSVSHIICLTEPTESLFSALSDVVQPFGKICLVVAGKGIEHLNLGFCFFKSATIFTETVFSSIRTGYEHIVPAKEMSVILEMVASQRISIPMATNVDTKTTSERFKDAIQPNGILTFFNRCTHHQGNYVMRVNSMDDIIFMDLKTASIFTIARKECVDRKILTLTKGTNEDVWAEQTQTPSEREERIGLLMKHRTLGIVKVAEKQWDDFEDGVELQEAENVKNLWGVQLKKREKNAKGEEFIFVDPHLRTIGEISRKKAVETGVITPSQNEGEESIAEAILDQEERDQLANLVRQALKLNLEVTGRTPTK